MNLEENQNGQTAMKHEMDALQQNQTWDQVPLPSGRKAIGCKWLFKIKHDADKAIRRHKVQLVAKA
mgnify:FL=1